MLRTNQEDFHSNSNSNVSNALKCQKRWRRKQIKSLYLQGHPIFKMSDSVEYAIEKWNSNLISIH